MTKRTKKRASRPKSHGASDISVVDDNTLNVQSTSEEHPSKRVRSLLGQPNILPSIKDLLQDYDPTYAGEADLSSRQRVLSLIDVFDHVFRDPMWSKVLNPDFQAMPHCQDALERHPDLSDLVNECAKSNDYQKLFESPLLRSPDLLSTPIQSESNNSEIVNNLEDFKNAFEQEYIAPSPGILLRTMDLYSPANPELYYNRSFPIVQSSGMGKSRLVDHSAKLRFTFPFNLEKINNTNVKTYPPADVNVRDYLTKGMSSQNEASRRHYAFLEALFTEALLVIESYKSGSVAEIALKWYEWMKEGSTRDTVGVHRARFYDEVVQKAKKLENENHLELGQRAQNLLVMAEKFKSRLLELHGDIEGQFYAIVYFDEAHMLHSEGDSYSYIALMRVLSYIVDVPIFFVFLSTNTNLQWFSPTRKNYPSARVQTSHDLIPPFFELPFDGFCQNFTAEAKRQGKLTLDGVCELGQMVKFGRPMWYSHYMSILKNETWPRGSIHPTIRLALNKLGYGKPISDESDDQNDHVKNARLAALDCRILLQFDPYTSHSRQTQSEMVRSYMRCVFIIPKSREYMWSGYPSEPMLSEAAARLLNGNNLTKSVIAYIAPRTLASAINTGLIARGERGETVARLLLTVAHDLTIITKHPKWQYGPHFHQPIPLLDLLHELFFTEVWEVVLAAKPVHAYPGCKMLKDAFSGSWVNFSHFVRLGDHESFELGFATELLKRGAGIQTYDNQRNQDIGIPVHFDNPTSKRPNSEIHRETTSIFQLQIKNTKEPAKTFPDPALIGPVSELYPILSIVMQLGAATHAATKQKVNIRSVDKGAGRPAGHTRSSTKPDIQSWHYEITVYGCTSATYGCIPKTESDTYASILRSQEPFKDAPRMGEEDSRNAYYALKPMLYKSEPSSSSWT